MDATTMFRGKATGDLPRIDFEGIAERADLPAIVEASEVHLRRGKGFCPFHDNTDTPALSVFLKGGRWRWKCWGACNTTGDAIDWVAKLDNITRVEAAKRLGGDDYRATPATIRDRPERPAAPEIWRDPEWQQAVDDLVADAEARLWSPEGMDALLWLRSRGLADRTIEQFRLGFVASNSWSAPVSALVDKGHDGRIFTPRGITIPWLAPGAWYSADEEEQPAGPRWVGCNVRRLADGDVFAGLPDEVQKYMAARGSSRGYLYPHPDILPMQGQLPMLVVEGEFDALLGFQEVGHRLHVATAGSASTLTLPRATRSALALTTWLLLAFDHDEAGVKAARAWRELYPYRSRRVLLPFGNDLGEFIQGGGDVHAWLAEIAASLRADAAK